MFKIKILTFLFTLIGSLLYSNISNAKSPVVIEFFGRNSCDSDIIFQEKLQNILQSEEDIILINCRTRHDNTKSDKSFTLQFCTDRQKLYNQKFRGYTFSTPVPVMLNGRWDGDHNDIDPAIRLARTDNIKTISININDNVINISIPEIKSNKKFGEILLYSYMPTIDKQAISINPDIELTKDSKNMSLATKARTSPLYLRPILSADKIGKWNGEKIDMTFPLHDITSLSGASYADLSYIVVLHEGDITGSILAAGEVISLKEMNNTLPHSEATNIRLLSPASKDLVQ